MKYIQKNPQKDCIDKKILIIEKLKIKKRGKLNGSGRTKRNGFIS